MYSDLNFNNQEDQLEEIYLEDDDMSMPQYIDNPNRNFGVINYLGCFENMAANSVDGVGYTSTNQTDTFLNQIPVCFDSMNNQREATSSSDFSDDYSNNFHQQEQQPHHQDNRNHFLSQALQQQSLYLLEAQTFSDNNNQSIMREGMNEVPQSIIEGCSLAEGVIPNQIQNNQIQQYQRRTYSDFTTCKVCKNIYKDLSGLFNHVRQKHTPQGQKVDVKSFAVKNSDRLGRPPKSLNKIAQ